MPSKDPSRDGARAAVPRRGRHIRGDGLAGPYEEPFTARLGNKLLAGEVPRAEPDERARAANVQESSAGLNRRDFLEGWIGSVLIGCCNNAPQRH